LNRTGVVVDESELPGVFAACSNVGRWGLNDELGTLNYINPAKRRTAAALVDRGLCVGIGLELHGGIGPAFRHAMIRTAEDRSVYPLLVAEDRFEVVPHGFSVTHIDALGHVALGSQLYNGQIAEEAMTTSGLVWGPISAMRDGIFTRGVLLDVAAARNVDWLDPSDVVEPRDLEAAEALANVRVETGDAVFVRVGLGARVAQEGPEDTTRRTGISPACLPWFHERQVAVYAGDCVDVLPSPYASMPLPFHQIALVSMGLVLLDCPDIEVLSAAAKRAGKSEFLLACSPLWIRGGTGSPVNPLCIF
jgi:kynurenine formamidase